MHHVTTDFHLAGKLMGIILEAPVEIELGALSEIRIEAHPPKNTQKWRLGVNSVVGNSFKDGYRDINITIGPMLPEKAKSFSVGFNNRLILDQLLSMMLPANSRKVVKSKTAEEHAGFRMGDGKHKAYLGINTRL